MSERGVKAPQGKLSAMISHSRGRRIGVWEMGNAPLPLAKVE